MTNKWLVVDFDKTLATYENGTFAWKNPTLLGDPIISMVAKVQRKLDEGVRVKIFTARVAPLFVNYGPYQLELATKAKKAIEHWCLVVFGQVLEVTALKDHECDEIWDDRCRQVVPNAGVFLDDCIY